MRTLQEFHDAEISGNIDWLYDRAWHVEIGKPKQAEAVVGSMSEAIEWLEQKAQELYGWEPDIHPEGRTVREFVEELKASPARSADDKILIRALRSALTKH